jgi:hypothetical protein
VLSAIFQDVLRVMIHQHAIHAVLDTILAMEFANRANCLVVHVPRLPHASPAIICTSMFLPIILACSVMTPLSEFLDASHVLIIFRMSHVMAAYRDTTLTARNVQAVPLRVWRAMQHIAYLVLITAITIT